MDRSFVMKVKIGRDFYDKKNDRIYTSGKIETVNKDVADWIVRNNLGYIIPNVRFGRPANIKNKKKGKAKTEDIEKPPKDRMVKKENIVKK